MGEVCNAQSVCIYLLKTWRCIASGTALWTVEKNTALKNVTLLDANKSVENVDSWSVK